MPDDLGLDEGRMGRSPSGLTVGMSPEARLELAMRRASNEDVTVDKPVGERWSFQGVANPFGSGIDAFEPNNVIFDAYQKAYGDAKVTELKQTAELIEKGTKLAQAATAGTPLVQGNGQVKSFIDAAMRAVGKPYVWGGTNLATGVDCSGLIYAAAKAAGLDLPRYRAIDYARLGQAVTLQEARPGDVVYIDNANTTTDHVGIYLGNGRMLQAPTTGQQVKVTAVGKFTSIRRIFDDNQFGTVMVAPGMPGTTYGGQTYNPTASPIPGWIGSIQPGGQTSVITRYQRPNTYGSRDGGGEF